MVAGGRSFVDIVCQRDLLVMFSRLTPSIRMMSFEERPTGSQSPDEEARGTKRKISLSNCGVCGFGEAKYKCPACLTRSCSLLCVKKHKEESPCSGVRNKSAFLKLSQFDEMTLLSDYRFLEDTGRFAGGAQRDNLIRAHVRYTPNRVKNLLVNARKMNIALRSLPRTFTKSKENSSIFNSREKMFLWHLKLVFPQSGTEFSQERVRDTLRLEQILMPYIHPTESDPIIRQKLKRYVCTPIEDVGVFMKEEGRKANSVRYHQLDLQKSLRDNLRYKILIEYPLLHVVLSDHWKDFAVEEPAAPGNAEHASDDLTLSCPLATLTATPQPSPESLSPREKRLKRELRDEELEEGEIADSEDEGETEEKIATMIIKTCDEDAKSKDGHHCIKEDAATVDKSGTAGATTETDDTLV
ncbi:box C/D snoRNA protein 1 [Syngnathus typhle]|uniref:box C/D snoRNA protein 1 n=1 Tax=Syngnathus typhle TaxID=161592 RepID=UPI002A69A2B0|nr:box C/D snoRNA protein 1 [Syngnathus typhle]